MKIEEVKSIVNKYFDNIVNIEEVSPGKIKDVYFFYTPEKPYVISFYDEDNINNDDVLESLLGQNSHVTNIVLHKGKYGDRIYAITDKIEGVFLDRDDIDLFVKNLNKVIECSCKVHMSNIQNQKGYGWIKNGHGISESLEDFVELMFKKDCDGYWKNWYGLFDNTFLDREEFFKLYDQIFDLLKFSTTKHLVHGDFFLNNIILSKKETIHLIDWDNAMFCDFLYDVASLHCELPWLDIKGKFKEYYINNNIDVPNFDERFKCMSLIKGLDGLRFYAKTNDEKSYNSVLQYLKEL